MKFLEKNLEDIIWENANTESGRIELIHRGLEIRGKLMRQVSLGGYGIADLISVYINNRYLEIEVYELKKDQIGIDALLQGCRYCTCVKRILNKIGYDVKYECEIRLNLIGDSIDVTSNFVFLYNMIYDWCDIYTYKYELDGLRFELMSHRYFNSNEHLQDINLNFKLSDVREMKNILRPF